MTITVSTSAPLVVVVGATGIQGGSVVKALAESDKPYRVRGLTRDPSKHAAQSLAERGVEVHAVSIVVENKDAVFKAFESADYAFLVTNVMEHLDGERELAEGKLMIDAASAAGVRGIVWSGLPSIITLSANKYTGVFFFESKAKVTAYGRASGVPFANVQAGYYGTNLFDPLMISKVTDAPSTYAICLPVRGTMTVPFIDAATDYGLFVRWVLEKPVFPDGVEFVAHAEEVNFNEIAHQLSKVTGKTILHHQITPDQFNAAHVASGIPPHFASARVDVHLAVEEFGWPIPPNPEGLGRHLKTAVEFVEESDWSKIIV